MIRLAGWAWVFAATGFLSWVIGMGCRRALIRRDARRAGRARKQAVLHSIEHSGSAVPTVRGHAYPLPRKDARP